MYRHHPPVTTSSTVGHAAGRPASPRRGLRVARHSRLRTHHQAGDSGAAPSQQEDPVLASLATIIADAPVSAPLKRAIGGIHQTLITHSETRSPTSEHQPLRGVSVRGFGHQGNADACRRLLQPGISCPKTGLWAQSGRSGQVGIGRAQASTLRVMLLDKEHQCVVRRDRQNRQPRQGIQGRPSMARLPSANSSTTSG